MAIIASAIFGRSAFTFDRIRIIRFISSEERCPLNMIYKHALGHVHVEGRTLTEEERTQALSAGVGEYAVVKPPTSLKR